MATHDASRATDDAVALRQLIMGFRLTQLIFVAARLGLADRLASEPLSAQGLAAAVGAEPEALHRLLRALASLGIFAETGDGRWELTPLAQPLRGDHPRSLRALALLYGAEWLWHAYGQTLYSVQTGLPAFGRVHGESLYTWFEQHPEAAATFNAAMTGYSAQETAALLAAYDFAGRHQVVDVGGGQGALLMELLAAYPALTGVLQDLAPVAAEARERLDRAGLGARCRCVGADFFETVPAGGDVYLLKSVLHNWDDRACNSILRNCRAAIRPDGRLVVAERVLPPGNQPAEAKLFDINMLVVSGGRERSADQYRALFEAAGFRLARVISTASPLSILEAAPA